jgi:hypothetical protein
MRDVGRRSGLWVSLLFFAACSRERVEPASPDASSPATPQSAAGESAPAEPAKDEPTTAPPDATASGSASAGASADAPPAPPPVVEPSLFDADGKLLPQLDDEPRDDSPVFQRRMALLFEAIVNDDAERARSVFFPVEAYEQVKAIEKPAADWKSRLWKNFVRDVHRYHDKLGERPEDARFVGFVPRTERKKWMKPNSEGNRLGYWRMTRNALEFRDAEGKERSLELTSVISWRGEWYVVHLNDFK